MEERSFWAIEMEFGQWEDWRSVEVFFHPPLDQLAACVVKIGAEGAKGVLAKDIVELVAVRRVEFESPR